MTRTPPAPAFEKPERAVNKVFVHCSASDSRAHDDVSVIKEWHLQRGFSDVGYHYFITKDGLMQPGRSLEQIPAAQKGHNTNSIAICLHGLEESAFTEAQFVTLRGLCLDINRAYGGKVTFHGHREVEPNKTCPVFDYKKVLKLDENGRMLLTEEDIRHGKEERGRSGSAISRIASGLRQRVLPGGKPGRKGGRR